jgi:hypothetical protein
MISANRQSAAWRKCVLPRSRTKWHEAKATIMGDTISVAIDGRPVAELSSPGIAHPTKRMLRLAVRRNAVVDDVRIRRAESPR